MNTATSSSWCFMGTGCPGRGGVAVPGGVRAPWGCGQGPMQAGWVGGWTGWALRPYGFWNSFCRSTHPQYHLWVSPGPSPYRHRLSCRQSQGEGGEQRCGAGLCGGAGRALGQRAGAARASPPSAALTAPPRRPARSSHRRLRPDLAPSPGRAVSSACREPRKSRRVRGKVPLSEREGHLGASLSGCVVLREGEARGSLSRRGRWGGGTRGPRGGRWCGAVCVKARWGCSWRPCGRVLRATLVSGQRTFLHPPALGGSVCAVSELC